MPSRLTFREKARGKAYQRIIREQYAAAGIGYQPPADEIDLSSAIVKRVSRKTAESIILKYEWLGTMAPTEHHYGIFFGDFCGGVVCVGANAGANIPAHHVFGIERQRLAYIARGACAHWTPTGTASKLLSYACRFMREDGFDVAIAYADQDAGEIGTVYQAANFLCYGRTVGTLQFVSPKGEIFDYKIVYDTNRKHNFKATPSEIKRRLIANGWKVQKGSKKYRYVRILADGKRGREILDRIRSMLVPYPKRGVSDTSDTAVVQTAKTGAVPSTPLKLVKTNGKAKATNKARSRQTENAARRRLQAARG